MSGFGRIKRIAINESRFREINERLRADLSELRHPPDPLALVCECGRLECREQILVTREEHDRLRSDPMLFAVAHGHEMPQAEDVVERKSEFTIVRKHEDSRDVAEATHRPSGPPGSS